MYHGPLSGPVYTWQVSTITPPTGQLLELGGRSGLRHHLRIDGNKDDGLLEAALAVATAEIDMPNGYLERTLLTRTLRLTINGCVPYTVRLPGPPVTAINSVQYRDQDDTFQTIDPADYLFDLTEDRQGVPLWPREVWPGGIEGGHDTFRVEYVAGYATAADVPEGIKQWLRMRVGELYRDRELSLLNVTNTILHHGSAMLDPWRVRT